MTSEEQFTIHKQIIADLKSFSQFKEMRASAAYQQHEKTLHQLFHTPRLYEVAETAPRLRDFLRVIVWNIERGTQLQAIIEALNHHPILRWADLLLLNELDIGMMRSGNRNVPLELSRALSAQAIYGAEYLEFTKGTGNELQLPGENQEALHGNAILTRYPFSAPEIVRLPRCENNFESAEKRLGGRLGIFVNIEINHFNLLAVTAHLDVVNTPRCRARQLRGVVQAITQRLSSTSQAVLLGGDFNTHTFARGNQFRALWSVVRIFGVSRERLARSLMRREPAINELARAGFDIDNFNDRQPTSSSLVSALDDKSSLPAPVRWWALRKVGPEGLRLEFRLDWLAAHGLRALQAGEVVDQATSIASVNPQTIKGLIAAGIPLSDHDPIVVDIAIK
jgi:endonuclease/exonuclease/phosphatase family metal-dependent hydrolase